MNHGGTENGAKDGGRMAVETLASFAVGGIGAKRGSAAHLGACASSRRVDRRAAVPAVGDPTGVARLLGTGEHDGGSQRSQWAASPRSTPMGRG